MKKKTLIKIVYYAVLSLLALIFLTPFLTMLSKSFMTYVEIRELPVRVFPRSPQWRNYTEVLEFKYLRMLLNTVIVAGVNMTAAPLMAAFSAFGFARMPFKLKKPLFAAIMATLMLPALVTQIPTYILFANLNMLNSLAPLFVSTFFGGGVLNIFLIMQFMRSIPKDIDNAATIDGANPFRVFFTIVLPLCKPILLYIAVSVFTGCWNDIQGPLIYLNSASASKYTLSLGFFYDFGSGGKYQLYKNRQMALGVLMTLPSAIIFFIFQEQLLEGVTMSAVKG